MNYSLELVIPPIAEPVTVQQLKDQGRIPAAAGTGQDSRITRMLKAARELVETATGQMIMTQTWRMITPQFPFGPMTLPFGPLQSVGSVKYYDYSDVQLTFLNTKYHVIKAVPPYISLKYGE